MKILEVKVNNFKNYQKEHFTFSKGINGFVGSNGVGKTNILDTIYFLSLTKSRFSLSDLQLVNDNSNYFRLESVFEDFKSSKNIKLVIKKQNPSKKIVEWNDAPYEKLIEHIGRIPVVFIIPEDTRLVADFSDTRRKEIDLVLSQVDVEYLKNLMQYNKILKQRNALLKNYQAKKDRGVMLDFYDSKLVEFGQIIFEKRKSFVTSWLNDLKSIYTSLSNNNEEIDCVYSSTLNKSSLLDDLQRNRDRDIMMKRTSFGIHKDDLIFSIGNKPLKKFGSQGQMKSFVLAIKLAIYKRMKTILNNKPILLLDDIFDKLDLNRVKNLLNLLQEDDFGQIFISDTHKDRLESILKQGNKDYKIFAIENGSISK